MRNTLILTFFLLLLASCTPQIPAPLITTASPQATLETKRVVPDCGLKPVKAPPYPKIIPGSTQLDETTGLHMTGKVQVIDLPAYRLRVTGLVEKELSLQYDELRCLPKVTANPLLVCRGFFEDKANWSGVPIAEILNLAKTLPEATTLTMISADGFKKKLDLSTAMHPENFLAYELEGQTLPILHGFPLRAVIPESEGNFWVKWIVEINIS
jgi:DMSO/TMAO reductase YedYZ molybdopterin-dependent catalytic subunit